MPKIFVLRNRLQEQQARLLETQKGHTTKEEPVEPQQQQEQQQDEDQPVALVIKKSQDNTKDNCPETGKYVSSFLLLISHSRM